VKSLFISVLSLAILISVLFHLGVGAILKHTHEPKPIPKIEVELKGGQKGASKVEKKLAKGNGKKKKKKDDEIKLTEEQRYNIIAKVPGGTHHISTKDGYWGFGIYLNWQITSFEGQTIRSAYVVKVMEGYPGEAAGIQNGDLIVSMGGLEPNSPGTPPYSDKKLHVQVIVIRNGIRNVMYIDSDWISTDPIKP
jgi:hypothetical protein